MVALVGRSDVVAGSPPVASIGHGPPWRGVLAAAAVLALGGGMLAGSAGSGAAVERAGAELVTLLRGMALLKLGMAAGAIWLVSWRMRFAINAPLAAGYVASVVAMAAAPGLIWQIGTVVPGAVAFHVGLVLMMALAYRDQDGGRRMLATRARRVTT